VSWEPLVAFLISLLGLWLLIVGVLWIFRPRDTSLGELVRVVPDVARLVRDLLRDRNVPLPARVALAVLLAWILNPIDLIPEFIPVLGPLDDAVVAVLVLRFVRRRIGDPEMRAHWRGTPEGYLLLTRLLGTS
jgi:uncharacterized membrane protein YkvA (DUF1232 family)